MGPYFGFLLDSFQSFERLDQEGENINVSEDDTNNFDLGISVGGIYYFTDKWGVAARFSQGFVDALGNDFFNNASGANAVLQFSALYHFR